MVWSGNGDVHNADLDAVNIDSEGDPRLKSIQRI